MHGCRLAHNEPEQWPVERTTLIVCDMWDAHLCKNTVTREVKMAPRMNEVIEKAHAAGRVHHARAERVHESLRGHYGTRAGKDRASFKAVSDEEWQMWMEHQRSHDHHASIRAHLARLERAGFAVADCVWRYAL